MNQQLKAKNQQLKDMNQQIKAKELPASLMA